MRRVLSLYLPTWPVDLLRRRWRKSSAGPWAPDATAPAMVLLVRDERARQVVVCGCPRALAAGVRPGMTLAHARALLHAARVHVETHRPQRDLAALHALARWSQRFSPSVAPDPPDGLLLDMTGSQRLFAGEPRLMRTILGDFGRLGLGVRGALAPTVGGAWALARYGEEASLIIDDEDLAPVLGPLPVRALRVDAEAEAALHLVGVERVDQLLALAREELAERFGADLLQRIDQALGRVFEPIETLAWEEPLRVARTFDGPVQQLEALALAVRDLAEQLARELQRRGCGVCRLILELHRLDVGALHETLTLSRPTRKAAHLWTLLWPRLERMNLGYGVEGVCLHAADVRRIVETQAAVWADAPLLDPAHAGDAPLDETAGELVDRLAERLGPERVTRLEVVETYVPEAAFVHGPVRETRGAGPPARVIDADRPSLLYAKPQPARVVLLWPDGPVVSLAWDGQARRIRVSVGPERITPRWWLVGPGRTPPARDYFKLQDDAGQWWWVYRRAGTAQWFVHGRWT